MRLRVEGWSCASREAGKPSGYGMGLKVCSLKGRRSLSEPISPLNEDFRPPNLASALRLRLAAFWL